MSFFKIYLASSILLLSSLAIGQDANELGSNVFTFSIPELPSKEGLDNFLQNLKSDTLPKFKALHQCVQKSRLITDSYRTLKDYGFGEQRKGNILILDANQNIPIDYKYDTHLTRNFESLKSSQDKALKAIEDFNQSLKLSEIENFEDIKSRLEGIDAQIAKLSSDLARTSQREETFIFLLEKSNENIRQSLSDSKDDIQFVLSDVCGSVPVSTIVGLIGNDLQKTIDGTEEMKSFIVTARNRRRAFVDYLYQYHRYKLTSAYAAYTHDELTNIQNKLLSVLATGRLIEDFTSWWSGVNRKGLADSLHTKYYQFEEPLRRLRATKEIAQSYLERVDAFKDSPESMKNVVRNQIKSAISVIDRSTQRLLEKTWKGQFEQQKLTVDAMLEIKDKLSPVCISKLAQFSILSQRIRSIDSFPLAEAKYADLIDQCESKEGVE